MFTIITIPNGSYNQRLLDKTAIAAGNEDYILIGPGESARARSYSQGSQSKTGLRAHAPRRFKRGARKDLARFVTMPAVANRKDLSGGTSPAIQSITIIFFSSTAY